MWLFLLLCFFFVFFLLVVVGFDIDGDVIELVYFEVKKKLIIRWRWVIFFYIWLILGIFWFCGIVSYWLVFYVLNFWVFWVLIGKLFFDILIFIWWIVVEWCFLFVVFFGLNIIVGWYKVGWKGKLVCWSRSKYKIIIVDVWEWCKWCFYFFGLL